MRILRKILIALGMFLITSQCYASKLQTVTYDDIRDVEDGFAGKQLSRVAAIFKSDQDLTRPELDALITSPFVDNVHTLDLSYQPEVVNDDIIRLANNPHYARLATLKLSGTTITEAALKALRDSQFIGSVRELPQVSGRWGIPSTTLHIEAGNTEHVPLEIKKNGLENFNIKIQYKPANPQVKYRPADRAVKIVEFSY